MKLKVFLYSADGTHVEREAEKVTAKTVDGEITILFNHARYFSELVEGKMKIDNYEIFTGKGFIIVKENY